MSFWRKFGIVVAAALLPVLLFGWGLVLSAYNVYGTPDRIKHAFNTSGIYNTLVGDILEQNKSEQPSSEGEISVDRPEINKIVQDAASPEFLKTQLEGFLDGAYAWIRGESEQLRVQINFEEVKTKLIAGLSQYATDRLNTLPVCAAGAGNTESFDPLNAECIPKGTNKQAAVDKIKAQIDKQFSDPVITQDDIAKDGQSLQEQLAAIPRIYGHLVLGMWLGAVLILLLAAAVILLSVPWRAGVKRVGIVFMIVGGVSALLAVISAYALKKAAESLGENELQASAVTVGRYLAEDFRTWWLGFGIVIFVLGLGAVLGQRFIGKPAAESAHHHDEATSKNPESHALDTPKPTAKNSETKQK